MKGGGGVESSKYMYYQKWIPQLKLHQQDVLKYVRLLDLEIVILTLKMTLNNPNITKMDSSVKNTSHHDFTLVRIFIS